MGKFIVVYLDDLTVFSKQHHDHVYHLRQVLERCRQNGISLNPKKLVFKVTEGKLLGHIVSREGTKIDSERVKSIQSLTFPASKTAVHSFFRKVNFLRRFILEFTEKTHHIVNMMKGKATFHWSVEGKVAFEDIKRAIAHALVLVCLDYTKDFIVYSYASKHTLSAILVQQNEEGVESPISFMSCPLKAHELKYSNMEKHAYAMVKEIKHFRFYILNSHTIVLVPDTTVKSILTQQEFGTKRGNWIAKIQEFDLDIKPTKLVRGRSLCQLIADNVPKETGDEEEKVEDMPTVLFVTTIDEWYSNIAHFLTYGECPSHLSYKEKRTVKLKAANYVLWDNGLYKRSLDGVFLHCVDKAQQNRLLESFQNLACGGHFSALVTAHKILRARYYWPTLFQDVYNWVCKCELCQQFVGKP